MRQMEKLQINSRRLGNLLNLGGLVKIGKKISQIVRTRFGFITETPRLNKILELYKDPKITKKIEVPKRNISFHIGRWHPNNNF